MNNNNIHYKWLAMMLLLVAAMVAPTSVWAQTMYTVFDTETSTLTFKYDKNKPTESTETQKVYDVHDSSTTPDWSKYHSGEIKTVVFDESFADARPKNCSYWFYNFSLLTVIQGIEYLNTSEVTDMCRMFYKCSQLDSLDLSSFNTENVKYMYNIFEGCSQLTSLNLSSFNTAKVDMMQMMFYGCSQLTSLDLSSFNTANVTIMYRMFYNCSNLTSIYVSGSFTTDDVTNSSEMFSKCSSLVGAIEYNLGITDKTGANYATGYFTYAIKNAADLASFAECVNTAGNEGAAAVLFNDITMTAEDTPAPMGNSGSYTGTFDGQGHTISGLNFSSNKSLFATNDGIIKKLGVVAQGSEGYICQTNSRTIDHCFYMGTTAEETTSPSGTVCQTNDGTVANCYYLADSETDAIEGTTYKTASQFKSGEVCYLLNNGTTDGTQTWYQNLSEENGDKWPVVTGTGKNTVYQVNSLCGGVSNIGKTYANTNEDVVKAHSLSETATFDSDKNIYRNVCQREGCGKTCYFADEESTIEATPNADLTYFTVADYPLSDATAYTSLARFSADKLSYTRKFSDNKWMAVYVPFHINCDKLEKEYEMAVINNFHEYEQEDGTYKVVLEVKRVTKGGTIPALTPCLIRIKTAPEAETYKTLTFTDVQFVPAAEKSTHCFSVTRNYEFFGTLNGKDGFNEYTDYVLSKGILYRAGYNTRLLPQRWYLTATTRDGNSSAYAKLRSITINDSGDGQATGIDDIHVNTESCTDASPAIYDLQGRRLTQEPQKGVYIKNGVKQVK